MAWKPKASAGHSNDSDTIIKPSEWEKTDGNGVLIEGVDSDRLLIWLSGGLLPPGRKEAMSVDARELYVLLSRYYGSVDHNPLDDEEH